MEKTNLVVKSIPLVTFDSATWISNDEYIDVANEIVEILKNNNFKNILIQNKALKVGDIEYSPLIMVNSSDFGGLSRSLELYIQDIVYEFIPDEE
jgi:hypothetical protein